MHEYCTRTVLLHNYSTVLLNNLLAVMSDEISRVSRVVICKGKRFAAYDLWYVYVHRVRDEEKYLLVLFSSTNVLYYCTCTKRCENRFLSATHSHHHHPLFQKVVTK
jgi:hypothetical protein